MWSLHGTRISVHDLLIAAGRPFLSASVAALVAATLASQTVDLSPPAVRVALGGAVMLGVYAWFLLVVMKQKSFYLSLLTGLFPAGVA
jgi:hypothetical protein